MCTHKFNIYIRGAFYKFPDFFVLAFKIVVDSWKFTILLLYILWDDWAIFMISASNERIQKELKYTQLKPDCHSWWISKIQSGCEDTLEERYAIKFCFKLGKMPQKQRIECFTLLFNHLAWIEHQFLSGIRDSRRCLWCNCYRRRKWTRRHEFKSWSRLIAFHIALIPLGKVWIQLFSLQLWVNSRTD